MEKFGVEWSPKAVHDWVQKADLQPVGDASPDHVVLNQTVIRINGQEYWLSAAVNPGTNEFLHTRLFTTTTTTLTQRSLREIREKLAVSEAVFLVNHAHHLAAALHRAELRFQSVRHGNQNAVERLFQEIPLRTSSFSNRFSHVEPATAETGLQAFAVWWNSLN